MYTLCWLVKFKDEIAFLSKRDYFSSSKIQQLVIHSVTLILDFESQSVTLALS